MIMRPTSDWEVEEGTREMQQWGEDWSSTPVTATPHEQKRGKTCWSHQSFPRRALSWLLGWSGFCRMAACIGYWLPMSSAFFFGMVVFASASLQPFPAGVPVSQPAENFMENTLRIRVLYTKCFSAALRSVLVWNMFILLAVRKNAKHLFLRSHSSQAMVITVLVIPQSLCWC